jgi:hypothetical protein
MFNPFRGLGSKELDPMQKGLFTWTTYPGKHCGLIHNCILFLSISYQKIIEPLNLLILLQKNGGDV